MNAFKTVQVATAALLLAASGLSLAEQPSYKYMEAGYGHVEIDGSTGSGEGGIWAGFSAQLADPIYISGDFQRYEIDYLRSSEDLDILKVNLGYRASITGNTDFNAELGYDDLQFGDSDNSGYRASLGIRNRASSQIQSRAYAGYTIDKDDTAEGDYFIGLEAAIGFNEHFGFTLQFETYEFDVNIARAGLRLTF